MTTFHNIELEKYKTEVEEIRKAIEFYVEN